ncbi:hypothetical protein F5050DRAFT_1823412 [Lentinula boryana]|uniref:Uncharacterized protein n=1 Tax=Lentinula boryana TaxID=40481 RepID=A0ABQ8QBS7_9AGAR|nr:hypothetical protein F5050DRAFT_1823412 [Lentinula boryana]
MFFRIYLILILGLVLVHNAAATPIVNAKADEPKGPPRSSMLKLAMASNTIIIATIILTEQGPSAIDVNTKVAFIEEKGEPLSNMRGFVKAAIADKIEQELNQKPSFVVYPDPYLVPGEKAIRFKFKKDEDVSFSEGHVKFSDNELSDHSEVEVLLTPFYPTITVTPPKH